MSDVMNSKNAAKYLGISLKTLIRKRAEGVGPIFLKYSSRAIRYIKEDLDTWINQHRIHINKKISSM